MKTKLTAVLLGIWVAGVTGGVVAQQTVAPPTPGGFVTRGAGGGVGVTTSSGPAVNTAGMQQALHARIQSLIRLQRYDEAEAATMELLQRERNTQYAPLYLRQIQAGRAALEEPLRQTIVPEVNFREAAFPDVVKFLGDMSAAHAPNKRPASFVLQVPPGTPLRPVTLNLRQVPLLDVLRYTTTAVGLEFRVEPHAVVIYKPQPAPARSPATATTPPPAPVP